MYCLFNLTLILILYWQEPTSYLRTTYVLIFWYHPYTGDGTQQNLAKLQWRNYTTGNMKIVFYLRYCVQDQVFRSSIQDVYYWYLLDSCSYTSVSRALSHPTGLTEEILLSAAVPSLLGSFAWRKFLIMLSLMIRVGNIVFHLPVRHPPCCPSSDSLVQTGRHSSEGYTL